MRFLGIVTILMALAVTTAAAQDYPYLGRVTGDEVRLRAGPSLGHRVLDLASTDDKLVVDGVAQDWLRIRVPGGVPCWVREDLVTVRGDEAVVTRTRVLLRPTAGQDYLPLEGRLEKDEKLRVIDVKTPEGEDLKWYCVLAPERIPVYVHAAFVERVGAVPADLADLARDRQARVVAGAAGATAAETVAKRDDGLRGRIRKVREGFESLSANPGSADGFEPLKTELSKVLSEADFRVTKLEAAGLYKDILLLEKRRELERARSAAALTEEQLRAAIREADEKYRQAVTGLAVLAPVREMQFTSVGVVHHRRGAWVIEKGGIPLYVLTSKLFAMKDFAGKKVGVRGPMVGEDPERGVRILDVEAVEIFD